MLEALKGCQNGSLDSFRKELLDAARKETSYRNENGYPSIADKNCDNETLLFRKSVLKKYFENVLFLSIRTKPGGVLFEQIAFSIAAGLSMIFATAIAFFFQKEYGNLTVPFFVALVVSYMFKDRLKDIARAVLGSVLRRFSFDRKLSIYENDGVRNKNIGICRERFRFLNEKDVPDDIWRIRNRDHITEVENGWVGETIVNYYKQIRLFPGWFKKAHEDFSIEGINDILRLNLTKFFLRMDDPVKSFWMCDDLDYYEASGDRVYHINAIAQYRSFNSTEKKRFRIVVNKEGIKRIEHVSVETF